MNRAKIHRVSPGQMRKYICQYAPPGRFLAKEGHQWVAMDNSTSDAWVEVFSHKHRAVRWLRGKFEVGDQVKHWNRIANAESLIRVAMRQGVTLDATEVDTILGYFEGHDYCLMADRGGQMMRHDEQYEDNHRGDELYTIQDAVEFCQTMNADLIREEHPEEEYLNQLRKDEHILDTLMEQLALCPASVREGK